MKQMLCLVALCMAVIASCMKEQGIPNSVHSQTLSKLTNIDDFYLSKNVKPLLHRIDSAVMVTVFSDSVYNDFGGSLKRIGFQFSNPGITYRNFKLTVMSTNGEQHTTYTAATTTMNNGVKELVFDNLGSGILLSPGWSKIVLRAKIFGNAGDMFHVTIPDGYITYNSVHDQPGMVVGLPLYTNGLKIR